MMSKALMLSATALMGLGGPLAVPVLAQEAVVKGAGDQSQSSKSASGSSEIAEIIVTAQKREQRINDVGMSITALSGDDLANRGVGDISELSKITPGFVATPTDNATPVYTIRGIGFYDTSLQATPAVTVYQNEIPLPYPIMTAFADLDLERVEVLKGPQGLLFGQNSTGGAINFIPARATSSFTAGTNLSVERFGRTKLGFFVSGPLSSTVKVRLAAGGDFGGEWQKSTSRDERLGNRNLLQSRLLVNFEPTDKLSFELNVSGWIDKSDPQALQLFELDPQNKAANPVVLANILAQPIDATNARSADWTPGFPQRNNHFYQIALRGQYDLTDDVILTSISSYQYAKQDENVSTGFRFLSDSAEIEGDISSYFQELRVSGQTGTLNWVVGANYSKASIFDSAKGYALNASVIPTTPSGAPIFDFATTDAKSDVRTLAGFANGEIELSPRLTFQAGLRYTDDRRIFYSCNSGPQSYITFKNNLQLALGGVVGTAQPGDCTSFFPNNILDLDGFNATLKEDSLSWRTGLNWKVSRDALLYANVSRGFKSGSFPTLAVSRNENYESVVQEQVTAYEAGFKVGLLDRALQVNSAVFYYDYLDKQLKSKKPDSVFGPRPALVNIPKSRLWGVEGSLSATPVDGLTLNLGATYLDSAVRGSFVTFGQEGLAVDIGGKPFPYTPKFMMTADGQYQWAVSRDWNAFFGASLLHSSRTTADIDNQPDYEIRAFTTIDLRVGIATEDSRWRITLYGKNITDEYYWTNVGRRVDSTYRLTARPATYGISAVFRY